MCICTRFSLLVRITSVGMALAIACATAAHAQTAATLQGTISDDQNLVLPGVNVTITNPETGFARTVVTDERGWYRAAALPPGTYNLTADTERAILMQVR